MATYRELTYMVMDQIKAVSDDSFVTEEHILFLLKYYRLVFLKQKIDKEGIANIASLPSLYTQTICLDLAPTNLIPGDNVCSELVLKSVQQVPDLYVGSSPTIYPITYLLNSQYSLVSKDRFKFVGHNKYMKNILYVTLDDNNYLYLKSLNPQFVYLRKIKVSAIFNDPEKAAEYACDKDGASTPCDILDTEYGLEGYMIPDVIKVVVADLLNTTWRQQDQNNNATDDMANLQAYIRQNTKSKLHNQLENV